MVLGLQLLVAGKRRSIRGTLDPFMEPHALVVGQARAMACPPCGAAEPEAHPEPHPTRDHEPATWTAPTRPLGQHARRADHRQERHVIGGRIDLGSTSQLARSAGSLPLTSRRPDLCLRDPRRLDLTANDLDARPLAALRRFDLADRRGHPRRRGVILRRRPLHLRGPRHPRPLATSPLDEGDFAVYSLAEGVIWGQEGQLRPPGGNLLITYNCFESESDDGFAQLVGLLGDAAQSFGGIAGTNGWIFEGAGAVASVIAMALALDNDDRLLVAQQSLGAAIQIQAANGVYWLIDRSGVNLNSDWNWVLRMEAWGCAEG